MICCQVNFGLHRLQTSVKVCEPVLLILIFFLLVHDTEPYGEDSLQANMVYLINGQLKRLWALLDVVFGRPLEDYGHTSGATYASVLRISWVMPKTTLEVLNSWPGVGSSGKKEEWWKLIPACIWWSIWKERNARCFEGQKINFQRIKANFSPSMREYGAADSGVKKFSIMSRYIPLRDDYFLTAYYNGRSALDELVVTHELVRPMTL
ncbi:hypothetical protein MTR67_032709 [Solanum verrucosum]|uniref:Uncharacterized protein n=1 Tax=Solanum verrucosum TaxID=315347 RepID=A0AAF0U4X5_SOLVR|nr:hypothetical protein MTR67_032709 [Solanum verrucosum]